MSCTVEEIQKSCEAKLQLVQVSTPEWGGAGHVYVRAMGADEADAIEKAVPRDEDGKAKESDAVVGWCILCVCDKTGKRLFDESSRAWLLKGPLAPLMRCSVVATKLNGLTDDLAGNSKTSPGDSSPSI